MYLFNFLLTCHFCCF